MAWKASLRAGLKAVRDGVDYVNTDRRYERAVKHLTRAYDELAGTPSPDQRTLAKICLWKGIALNENLDVRDPAARNDPAIAAYRRGLAHLRRAPADADDATKMSLLNSLGVAHHHRVGGGTDPRRRAVAAPIPVASVRYYRLARALFVESKQTNTFTALMAKVENNSGRGVIRGGGASTCGNFVDV